MKLTVRKSDFTDDWYVIEKAEHDGRVWMEPIPGGGFALQTSSRFSDADVEGEASAMLAIADAIEKRTETSFTRCAVAVNGDTAEFWSPRNSTKHGFTSITEADELASLIRKECAR
jgi:hypothetical protein